MINFTDLVNIQKANGYDSWGVSQNTNIDEDVPCKVMYSLKRKELVNAEGDMVVVSANIYFEGMYSISHEDLIEFVDAFGDTHVFEILDRKPIIDFSDEVVYTRVSV